MTTFPTITTAELSALKRALVEGIIVETSGSTAKPKRVSLSAQALKASALATAEHIGIGNWVLVLPLSYIAGIMVGVRSLVAGTQLVDLRAEPFDASTFAQAVAELPEGRWLTSLVPTQLARLVDAAETSEGVAELLRKFSTILVGGQSIPAGLVDRATTIGARVIRTYGSAETSGGVVYDGIPIGDTRLRIANDGVLEISSSSLADGYIDDEAQTIESFIDGWYRTSDLAHIEDGRLVIDGRWDDIIVTGGVKVSLSDIEHALHSAGIDACATWFPNNEWGQVPALVSTTELDYDRTRKIIEDELGKAARPYRLVTVDEIPMLPSGKVDRIALRNIVADQHP